MNKYFTENFSHLARAAATVENGILLVAVLIAGSLLWNTMGALQRNFQLQQRVDVLAQETELLQLETQNMQFQKKYLQSPEYLELSARETLGLAAPGEKVIILPEQPQPAAPASAQPASYTRSNFELWLYFFFGRRSG